MRPGGPHTAPPATAQRAPAPGGHCAARLRAPCQAGPPAALGRALLPLVFESSRPERPTPVQRWLRHSPGSPRTAQPLGPRGPLAQAENRGSGPQRGQAPGPPPRPRLSHGQGGSAGRDVAPAASTAARLLSLRLSTPCRHGLLLPRGHGSRLGRMGKWVLSTKRKPLLAGADQAGVTPRHTQGGGDKGEHARGRAALPGAPGRAGAPAPRESPAGPRAARPQRGAGVHPHLAVRSRWRWCRKEEGRLGAGPRARRRSFVSLQR